MNVDVVAEWERGKGWFEGNTIPDLSIEGMDLQRWKTLTHWLAGNDLVTNVDFYIPATGENIDFIPLNAIELLDEDQHYCSYRLTLKGVNLLVRFMCVEDIMCDVYTDEISNAGDYETLLQLVDMVQTVTGTNQFAISEEGSDIFAFNENGKFTKTFSDYLIWENDMMGLNDPPPVPVKVSIWSSILSFISRR